MSLLVTSPLTALAAGVTATKTPASKSGKSNQPKNNSAQPTPAPRIIKLTPEQAEEYQALEAIKKAQYEKASVDEMIPLMQNIAKLYEKQDQAYKASPYWEGIVKLREYEASQKPAAERPAMGKGILESIVVLQDFYRRYPNPVNNSKNIQQAKKVVDIQKFVTGNQTSAEVASAMLDVVTAYRDASQYKEARDYLNTNMTTLQANKITNTRAALLAAKLELDLNDNDTALTKFNDAIILAQKNFGKYSENLSDAYFDMAMYYDAVNKPHDADRYYEKAFNIRRKNKAMDQWQLIKTFRDLAKTAMEQHETNRSIRYLLRANYFLRLAPEKDSLENAEALHQLAMYHTELKRYNDAEVLYRRALAMKIKLVDKDDLLLASTMNNLAMVLLFKDQPAPAETLMNQATQIKAKHLQPNDPRLANSYNNLAMILDALGRQGEAADYYQKTIEIYETTYGKDSEKVANVLYYYGAMHVRNKQWDKALPLLQRTLAIREKVNGKDHPSVGRVLGLLSFCFNGLQKPQQAEATLKQAVSIYEKLGSDGARDLKLSASQLAKFYEEHDRLKEATAIREKYQLAAPPQVAPVPDAKNNKSDKENQKSPDEIEQPELPTTE